MCNSPHVFDWSTLTNYLQYMYVCMYNTLYFHQVYHLFQPHPLLHRVLELSYDRNFKHVIVVQDYCAEGSLKDMIYKMVCNKLHIMNVLSMLLWCL